MKYYEIVINSDLPVSGKYPQVKDLKIDFHEARASQWGKIRSWEDDDDIPDLDNFIFQKGVKPTDLISNSFVVVTSGIFISERAKIVLKSFKINGNFYSMTVFMGETPHKYYFLWYEIGAKSKIDWKTSSFIEYNSRTEEYGNKITVEDFEDYKTQLHKMIAVKENWKFKVERLKFKEYFDITPAFNSGLICNEKVKKAIEENKLTGFMFKPLDVEIQFETTKC